MNKPTVGRNSIGVPRDYEGAQPSPQWLRAISTGIKRLRLRREINRSTATSNEIGNGGAIPPHPSTSSCSSSQQRL
jgi:hypothetical protein